VKLHCTEKLKNGEVFDTSENRYAFEFTIGSGKTISSIEKGIIVTNPRNNLMNRIIKRIFKIKGGANEYLCG